MVDEYDSPYELPELNEEGICDYLQESTDSKMIDKYYAFDPDMIEPTEELLYDYPIATGVVSGEDDITVDMTANPAYGIAMCSKLAMPQGNCMQLFKTPDMVDEYDCELPELNEEGTYGNSSHCQPIDSKMIDDNVSDPSITAPGREVACDYSTGVRSGKDEVATSLRRVEMIPNPVYGTVTCSKDACLSKLMIMKL